MLSVRWSYLAGAIALVYFPAAAAWPASIDHEAVSCVVADRFPQLEARFTPADAVGRARVLFRTETAPVWYGVTMKREGDVFAAALPKPRKSLRRFVYYVEVADTNLVTSRSEEHTVEVVAGEGGCAKGVVAAAVTAATVLLEVPVGAAAIPAGFSGAGVVAAGSATAAGGAAAASSGGGLSSTAIVAGVGVAAAAGAVVAVKAAGDEGSPADISGQVFARLVPNPANPAGPGIYVDPVAGAVVSTSIDGVTATTDGEGRFRLVTRDSVRGDQCYTITITAGGQPVYSLSGGWGNNPSGQIFCLSPPAPSSVGPCTP
jgi:hypothetical protein